MPPGCITVLAEWHIILKYNMTECFICYSMKDSKSLFSWHHTLEQFTSCVLVTGFSIFHVFRISVLGEKVVLLNTRQTFLQSVWCIQPTTNGAPASNHPVRWWWRRRGQQFFREQQPLLSSAAASSSLCTSEQPYWWPDAVHCYIWFWTRLVICSHFKFLKQW